MVVFPYVFFCRAKNVFECFWFKDFILFYRERFIFPFCWRKFRVAKRENNSCAEQKMLNILKVSRKDYGREKRIDVKMLWKYLRSSCCFSSIHFLSISFLHTPTHTHIFFLMEYLILRQQMHNFLSYKRHKHLVKGNSLDSFLWRW